MTTVADDKDGFRITGASATQGPYSLLGGRYGVCVTATFGGGSVTLQMLAADGSTYVTCLAAFTAAGYATVDLPPCEVQVAIATATGVAVSVTKIPRL